MKILKTKMILAVVTALLLVLTLPFLQSCSDENVNMGNELSEFILKNSLKSIKNNNVIQFNTIEEAEQYINKIKHSRKQTRVMSFNVNDFKNKRFCVSDGKGKPFKIQRFKTSATEERGWETTMDAGNFSDFQLEFNTGINDLNIDRSSINLSTTGFRFGWSYAQDGVTMIDADSFIIKGTVTWGVGVQGATLGFDDELDIRIDINWSTGKVTWTEL